MATTPIQFKGPPGLSLKLELYPFGSDTIANTAGGDTATEKTNAHGLYSAPVTENITGLHDAVILDGSDNLIATYSVNIRANDTTIYRCSDDVAGLVALPNAQVNNFDPTSDAVAVVTLVTATTTNSDMRGTDGANTTVPPTANANADAYLDRPNAIETGVTPRQSDRIKLAALAGKSSGHTANAPVYRNVGDTKNRITATTVADGRSAVTVDGT